MLNTSSSQFDISPVFKITIIEERIKIFSYKIFLGNIFALLDILIIKVKKKQESVFS